MRTLETPIGDAFNAGVVRGIYFTRLVFDEGIIAWHSGFGNIEFDSVTYIGAGQLSSISQIKEESGVKATGATVSLSGVKQEVITAVLNAQHINRKAYIHFMPLDEENQPVSATPYLLFRGTMDSINGTQGKTPNFSVTLKSRFADWERPRKSLYTDVEQQRLHPGDKGMEYVAQISQKKIIWPRAAYLPDPRD